MQVLALQREFIDELQHFVICHHWLVVRIAFYLGYVARS